jgi:hypothetical protein
MNAPRPAGTSPAYHLIGGAFAFQSAPFAAHSNDRKLAADYLREAINLNLRWPDAEADIMIYLKGQGAAADYIDEQIEIARRFLGPWLS